MTLGRPRVHLRSTGSTNDRARELALAGAPHGTLVTAFEQTAGRGRQGRSWYAPAGRALAMSLVLRRPLEAPADEPVLHGAAGAPADELLSLRAGVAVCDAVGKAAHLKWPNDVVLGGGLAKLAGILVEGRPQEGWAVLGIGVNVAVRVEQLPRALRASAATLDLEPEDVEPLRERLLEALERCLAEPADSLLERWRARDALRGMRICWADVQGGAEGSQGRADGRAELPAKPAEGRAEGIDGRGRLIVVMDDGRRTALGAGEVHLSGETG